jgi:DNA (cytosine-5)-methyltransferase 1
MAEAGAVAIEWSVLDAQHFGIPQRRRRVFVIAIFDPVLANRCPNPLLPVSESLPRDTKKGKSKRQSATTTSTESVGTDGAWWDGRDTAEALTTTSNEQRIPFNNGLESFANYTEGVGTLRSNGGDLGGGSETLLAFDTQFGSNANVTENVAPTLKASQQSPSVAYNAEPTMAVRRLTPLECERLMGWPDGHTQYKADGTEQADTHRYKQADNGVASPVAQWIAKHILAI